MIEVTKQNFKEIYPILEDVLKDAAFISFDLEFSGIESNNIRNRLVCDPSIFVQILQDMSMLICLHVCSLFDSIEKRYDNNRNSIQPYVIVQFGITAFQQDKSMIYNAVVFNFFLLPKSIPSKNRQFLWDISALEFLSEYEFDFNKVYHIPSRSVYVLKVKSFTCDNQVIQIFQVKCNSLSCHQKQIDYICHEIAVYLQWYFIH